MYVALIVAAILFGHPTFQILLALFCLLAILESIKLNTDDPPRNMQLTGFVYAGILVYLTAFQELDPFNFHFLIALVLQLAMIYFIFKSFQAKGKSGLLYDTLYIWLPLFALGVYAVQGKGNMEHHLLFFFITIWIYDSMAYVSGKLLGRNPIFPKVSPKKTIEGTVGGVVLTLTAVYFIDAYWLDLSFNALIAGFIIIVAATAGDFFQSYYKRQIGVKDSGNLIPGHGGILDRIDSILFSCLPFITYVVLIAEK